MHLSIISHELKIIVYSVIFGCIFALLYDIIKFVRNMLPQNDKGRVYACVKDVFLLNVLDIIYFIFLAVSFSIFLFYYNCGIVRWYFAVSTAIGFWLYRHSLGIVITAVSDFLSRLIHVIFRWLFVIPSIYIFKIILFVISPIFKLVVFGAGIIRTGRSKKRIFKMLEAVAWEGEA